MSRSLKKGPFIDDHLLKKVDALNQANEKKVIKSFVKEKEVASIKLDPMRETADIDESNNSWRNIPAPSRFTVFKQGQMGGRRSGGGQAGNPMQRAQEAKKGF